MLGVQIGERAEMAAGKLGPALMREGLLTTICGGHTIRLLLPYYADRPILERAWKCIAAAVAAPA